MARRRQGRGGGRKAELRKAEEASGGSLDRPSTSESDSTRTSSNSSSRPVSREEDRECKAQEQLEAGTCADEPQCSSSQSGCEEPPLPCAEPERAPTFSPAETLVVLDWDDTCLPSSWINAHGLRLDSAVPPQCYSALEELAPRVQALFRCCKSRGTVLVITNAERGWVERSCEKFLPSVVNDLEGVRVFSARLAYEEEGVFAPLEWKRKAFAAIIKETQDASEHAIRNVLSLGDSPHERDALFTARDVLCRGTDTGAHRWRSKSVKFMERPDACQLLREHALVLQFFDQVVEHDGDLDLCIECCY